MKIFHSSGYKKSQNYTRNYMSKMHNFNQIQNVTLFKKYIFEFTKKHL